MSQRTLDSAEYLAFQIIERMIDQVTFTDDQDVSKCEKYSLSLLQNNNTKAHSTAQVLVEKEDQAADGAIKNISWPTVGDFTEKLAIQKLDEFIQTTWEHDKLWLYCIDPLEKVEKEFTYLHNFRVRWSIPTRRKPIPKFTASVYFTFDVSKIKPKNSVVDVYYVFETQKLVHRPGLSRFRQEWLSDIIDLKESVLIDCKF